MGNNVFYKTTIAAYLMDFNLVNYLEEQLDEIADDLMSIDGNTANNRIWYIINILDPGFFSRSAAGIPGDSFVKPTVILSDRTKPMTYGSLSLKELKTELKKFQATAISRRVQDAIDDILPILEKASDRRLTDDEEEKINSILREILDSIDRREFFGQEVDEICKLVALFGDVRQTCAVYGEYIAKLNLIVLYCDTIRNDADLSGQDADSLFTMVLAHEMFHAFHCQTVGENRFCSTGGRTRKLKTQNTQLTESLADYYAVYYLITLCNRNNQRCFFEVADRRYTAWKKNLFWSWPYSRALYFFTPDPFGHTRRLIELPNRIEEHLDEYDRSFEKFIKVFLTVADDNREEAYRILLDEKK